MAIASDAPALLLGLVRLLDVALVVLCGAASYALRADRFEIPGVYLIAILVGGLLTANVLHLGGVYALRSMQQLGSQLGQLIAGWSAVVLSLIVLAYFTKTSDEFSRIWMVLWVGASFAAMSAVRLVAYWQLEHWRRSGLLSIKVAVVGATELAQKLLQQLALRGEAQYEVIGIYDDRKTRIETRIEGIPVRGRVGELVAHFRESPVDEIVIALPWRAEQRIATVIKALHTLPANVRLCPEGAALELPVRGFTTLGGVPMLGIFRRPLTGWNLVLKALEDRLLAALIGLLMLPLMALIAIAIKLDSSGPVLFRQKRYGFNGNEITVWKFRTMSAAAGDSGDTRQATRGDPRVTRIGGFLRRTSLDELPQLFNVLRGEMSLVGPRPHALTHNEQFAKVIDDYLSRHRMKPGITGWAQVNGLRGEVDTPGKIHLRVQYDLFYIDHWSLLFDLKILFLTLFVGFVHRNAY